MSNTMCSPGVRRVLALLLLCAATLAWGVELIVNSAVPVTSMSRPLARLVFAAKMTRWEDGSPIRVFVLPDESLVHQEMSKGNLDLYPYQLRMAWDRAIYTGIGQAPIQVANEAEMRKQVASVPGAIGYIGRISNNDKVRVLPVR
jgi:ABC-type phosphate transport system substrate-binding protein